MKTRIESATKTGQISEAIRRENKGFLEWDFVSSRHDHQTIIQVLSFLIYVLILIILSYYHSNSNDISTFNLIIVENYRNLID